MVAVRCFTYNQAMFICQTLEGFTMQETNFHFIILLVDDASTDGEQHVIEEYIASNFVASEEHEVDYARIIKARHRTNRYCSIVAMLLNENHYSKGQNNRKLTYLQPWRQECIYESICEGDDYWTDSRKLQVEYDILSSNDKIGLVYTKALIFNQQSGEFSKRLLGRRSTSFSALMYRPFIPTLTVMYRIDALNGYLEYIDWKSWVIGDYPMWLYISMRYRVVYLNRVTAVYRELRESATHSLSYETNRRRLESMVEIRELFLKRVDMSARKKIRIMDYAYSRLFRMAYKANMVEDAERFFKRMKHHTLQHHWRMYKMRVYSN